MSTIMVSTPFECELLKTILNTVKDKSVYLEIGTSRGMSLEFMSEIIDKDGLMICVDIKKSPKLNDRLNKVQKTHNVKFIEGCSRQSETINKVRDILNGKQVDVLFIDGDHTLYGVAADIHNYTPLVKENGIIMFHDCATCNNGQLEKDRRVIAEVHGCFRGFVFDRPYVLIQENVGLGIVFNKNIKNTNKVYVYD